MDGNVCPLPQIKELADRWKTRNFQRVNFLKVESVTTLFFDNFFNVLGENVSPGMEHQFSLMSATRLGSLEKLAEELRYFFISLLSIKWIF